MKIVTYWEIPLAAQHVSVHTKCSEILYVCSMTMVRSVIERVVREYRELVNSEHMYSSSAGTRENGNCNSTYWEIPLAAQ